MKRMVWICAALLALLSLLTACASKSQQVVWPAEKKTAPAQPMKQSEQPAADEKEAREDENAEWLEQHVSEPVEEDEESIEKETPEKALAEEKQSEPVGQSAADPEAEWQITLDNTDFLQSGETLVKAYEIDDAYAVAYTRTGDGTFAFQGRALLIDRQSGSVKEELYNSATDKYQIEVGTLTPIRVGERILFGFKKVYWSTTEDFYCTMEGGTLKKSRMPLNESKYVDHLGFKTSIRVSVNDIDYDTNPELFMEHFGWDYHTYWCFWSEDTLDMREYKGIEITREELAMLETGDSVVQQCIRKMEQDGYVFDTMYLRGNGILNVNFHEVQENYQNLACSTYLYSDGVFVPYPDAEFSFAGGRYEASQWKDEYCEAVMFQPLAELREN